LAMFDLGYGLTRAMFDFKTAVLVLFDGVGELFEYSAIFPFIFFSSYFSFNAQPKGPKAQSSQSKGLNSLRLRAFA